MISLVLLAASAGAVVAAGMQARAARLGLASAAHAVRRAHHVGREQRLLA